MNIKEVRTKFNISQAEMASILGVSQPTVLRWEMGKTSISEGNMEKIKRLIALADTVSIVKCGDKEAKISMYLAPVEHNPPHFHANLGKDRSKWFRVNIKTCKPMTTDKSIAESNNRKDVDTICQWAVDNKEALLSNWDKCMNTIKPSKI